MGGGRLTCAIPSGLTAVLLVGLDLKVFEGGLPWSDRLATGDVWAGDLRWTGGGIGSHDKLAVHPAGDGT